MTTSIQAELPEQLLVRAQALVHDGWDSDINEILADALGRYLESHSADLTEAFMHEDVEWGLRGSG